jgi:O-antigen ligase
MGLLLGGLLGLAIVVEPRLAVGAAVAALGLAVASYSAVRWPGASLVACGILVLLAGTKFRQREATASLEGVIDLQVLFELAVYGVIAVIVVIVFLGGFGSWRKPTKVELVVAAHGSLALASVAWSSTRGVTIVRASQFLILVALAMVAVRQLGSQRLLASLKGSIVGYVLVAAALSVAVPGVAANYVTWLGVNRFSWFNVHPLGAADAAAIGSLLLGTTLLVRGRGDRPIHRLLALVAALTLLAVLLATRSRGPAIAWTIAAAAVVLISIAPRKWLALAVLAATIGLGTLLVARFSPVELLESDEFRTSLVGRYVYRGAGIDNVTSFSGRIGVWREAASLAREHPLRGVGYLSSREALLEIAPWVAHAHSGPLQTMLDLGLLGLLTWWAPVLLVLARASRGPPYKDADSREAWTLSVALLLFLVLASGYNPGIAGQAGLHTLFALAALVAVEDLRQRGAAAGSARETTATGSLLPSRR